MLQAWVHFFIISTINEKEEKKFMVSAMKEFS